MVRNGWNLHLAILFKNTFARSFHLRTSPFAIPKRVNHSKPMKKNQTISILLLLATLFSCGGKPEASAGSGKAETLDPKVDVKELQSDFFNWWTYHSNSIMLSSDFVGKDELSETLGKKEFLEKLGTGKFIPLRLASESGRETYKLFPLDSSAYEHIGSTMANESMTNLKHFNMEGMPFPEFDLTDLAGNRYTNQNTQGKTLIVKTWFIACKACIEEFPELNELVKKHRKRDDLIFLSLALDTPAELEEFLKKRNFTYQVVPEQKEFIMGKLDLQIYPSHLIVDQNGSIVKVVNKASEMMLFLEKELEGKKLASPSTPQK